MQSESVACDGPVTQPEGRAAKRTHDEMEPHTDEHPAKSNRRKKACETCRLRKVKCDAKRPCGLCRQSGASAQCKYTDGDEPPMTIQSATGVLSHKLDDIESKLDALMGATLPSHDRETFENPIMEPAKDFLQIPAQKTSADVVLTWPIFEGQFSLNCLVEVLFTPERDEETSSGGLDLHNGTRVVTLVEQFLQNVHTKNPILDVELLLSQTRRVALEGFGNDASSCLVLIACALGSIAVPFESSPSSHHQGDEKPPGFVEQAQSYFRLALLRLGLLRPTILGVQCYFYAGVYLMYTLRPLSAWRHFNSASMLYQLYERLNYGVNGPNGRSPDFTKSSSLSGSTKQARLEQCLYWSCFKSESEFRVELPLPLTEVANHQHSEMFPIPPTPQELNPRTYEVSPESASYSPVVSERETEESIIQQSLLSKQTKKLCNEEESWYYYLTEIALRRVGNRIVNTFFNRDPEAWLNVKPLLRIALEFDTQLSSWSANLPPAMQQWETTYTIREPVSGASTGGPGAHVSQELSWATENRLLEARSWLYQPFLFNLIHHRHRSSDCEMCPPPLSVATTQHNLQAIGAGDSGGLGPSTNETTPLRRLIQSGIECNLRILDNRMARHRHHGTWFDLRSIVCASLILLMVVKSGHETWIPGGAEFLWGSISNAYNKEDAVGGRLGQVLDHLLFWSTDSPDMIRHRDVLEVVTRDVRELWHWKYAGQ
ncbi:hypothetical protein Q7P37_006118 [Cladosporium fusiforme]